MLRQLAWKFSLPILLILSMAAYMVAPYIDGFLTGWFRSDVELRSRLVFNSLEYSVLGLARDGNPVALGQFLLRLTEDERLQAIVICDHAGDLLQKTPGTPDSVKCSPPGARVANQTVAATGGRLH
ncbi:MAG: hypothetical protein ABI905_12500, partial [Betaproteobacteria bacterium]